MAYDEVAAHRVRALINAHNPVEKKMFGGIAFLLGGNMAVGVNKDHLMVRVGPDGHDDAVSKPHARVMDFTGKPMRGWIIVEAPGYESDDDLAGWVQRGVEFAKSLPPK
jgi:TfoX/Sxy family transcriptional regulator of competence genes